MNQTIKKRIEEINNGIVPEGYEKTSFGIFPCDWEKSKTLKDIGKFGKGRGIPGNKLISEGVPCVGYGDIYMKYNYHFEKAQSFVDESTAAESQKISKGTLLFTATGETADEIGKCVCYNGNEDIYAGGDIITFITYKINSMFIAYQQYQNFALRQKASLGQGHSVVHIQKDRLEKLHIAYPKSDSEQSRIAEILMQWDKAIELQEKLIEAYQKSKKYYLNKMFPKKGSNVPEIRFPGFTAPWEQRKVGELLEERDVKAPKSLEYPLMAFIANEGVAPKGDRYDRSALVNDTENKPYKQTELGDFIYSSNNLETGSIGLNKYGKASISPVYSIFYSTGLADSDFLGRRFVRKDFINEMVKWRQGVIYGQWRIHESDFVKIEVAVPCVEEQRKIGRLLDNIDNLITLHQQKRDKLVAQRKAMQQYLLTGIVRV